MDRQYTVGFIGAGNMGMALIRGFMKSQAANNINAFAYDIDMSKKILLSELNVTFLNSEIEITQSCKYVFLITKPQQAGDTLKKIAPYINPESVLVSLCAGISEDFIIKHTGNKNLKIILVMPNTPMMLGAGACAAARGRNASDEEFYFVRSVLETCGLCVEISPDKMNEIICVNASSPAFIYYFAECFADYAENAGVEQDAAFRLFAQTLIGAGKMMLETGKTAKELTRQVTSKGGTTFAGLEQLDNSNFKNAVKRACEACTARAYELGE